MYLKFNLIKIYTQPNNYILSINFHIYYHWDILILVMHNPINLWILWPKIKVVNEAQFITVYSGKKTFIQKKSNHFSSIKSLSLSLSLDKKKILSLSLLYPLRYSSIKKGIEESHPLKAIFWLSTSLTQLFFKSIDLFSDRLDSLIFFWIQLKGLIFEDLKTLIVYFLCR